MSPHHAQPPWNANVFSDTETVQVLPPLHYVWVLLKVVNVHVILPPATRTGPPAQPLRRYGTSARNTLGNAHHVEKLPYAATESTTNGVPYKDVKTLASTNLQVCATLCRATVKSQTLPTGTVGSIVVPITTTRGYHKPAGGTEHRPL